MAQAAAPRLESFKPRDVATIAWAFATMFEINHSLMVAIFSSAQARISEFGPLDLASLAWSLAAVGWSEPPLLDAISLAVQVGFGASRKRMGAQALSNIVWSFATLR